MRDTINIWEASKLATEASDRRIRETCQHLPEVELIVLMVRQAIQDAFRTGAEGDKR